MSFVDQEFCKLCSAECPESVSWQESRGVGLRSLYRTLPLRQSSAKMCYTSTFNISVIFFSSLNVTSLNRCLFSEGKKEGRRNDVWKRTTKGLLSVPRLKSWLASSTNIWVHQNLGKQKYEPSSITEEMKWREWICFCSDRLGKFCT